MKKDYSQVNPEILDRAIDEVASEVAEQIVDEGKLIHTRIGHRFNSAEVKAQINALSYESHGGFVDPIDFTEHHDVKTLPGKGITSATRIAKG